MTQSIQTGTRPISLAETQSLVVEALQAHFLQARQQAAGLDPAYQRLWELLETVSLAGGKRMRPHLALLAYQGLSGRPIGPVVPVAAALELLHIAMLVHDDIIDRDYVRHGQLNVSGHFDHDYQSFVGEPGLRRHYADSASLLAGDLALSSAYLMTQRADIDDRQKLLAQRILGEAVFNVAGGELIDTETAFKPHGTFEPLDVYRLKTASYSFVSPLTMGAQLADASEHTLEQLQAFGQQLGIAFQLRDDLLGVFGDEAQTGKSTSGDLREGKYTYLVQQSLRLAGAADRQLLQDLLGRPDLDQAQANSLRSVMERSGARQQTEVMVETYASRARAALATIRIQPECRTALADIVSRCVERTA